MIKTNMKYSPHKKALALVLAFVLVFGMAIPGFAAYDNGGNSGNGTYNGQTATEQTTTPSDLLTTDVQTTSPAALQGYIPIVPLNQRTAPLILTAGTSASDAAENWDWNHNTLTLTLSGVDINVAVGPGIQIPANSTIVLATGTTNIITNAQTGGANTAFGIQALGDISIIGSGSLEINSGGTGINSAGLGGNLTITDSTIEIISGINGINAGSTMTFNDAQITIDAANHGIGIAVNLIITGGNFDITAGQHGLNMNNNITIQGGADVIIDAGGNGIQTTLGDVTISGDNTVVNAPDGINAGGNIIINGTPTVISGPPSATIGDVIIGNAGGNVVITLVNDTFAATLTNTNSWITNPPTGFTQAATRNSDTQVTIAIGGAPIATHNAMPIEISIPSASLVTSTTNLAATTNPSAVFTTLASRITAQITAPQPNGGAAWNTTDESGNITRNVVVTLPGRIYTSATITASGIGVSGSASLAATDSGNTITVPVTVPGTRPSDLTVTFTLTGDAAQASVPPYIFWNSVTITVPATTAADTPITTAQITVTAPATGATPNTTATIASGTGFTAGSVSWTALGTAAGSTFLGDRQYTATVTLTAVTGNTFTGLTAGSNVTINNNNATITNNIGTAVTLSFQFASTAPAPINSAAINVTVPVMGAIRNTTATGTGNFNISAVTWTPSTGTQFTGSQQYTASVTLTAHAGHTFPTGFIGTINTNNAIITNTSPDIAANSVTLAWEFPATGAAPVAPTITSGAPPNGTVGTAYNFTFTATGTAPITWSHTGNLPSGIGLTAGGVLSGTPTTAGNFTFTIQASNVAGNPTQTHTIVIGTAATAPSAPLNLTAVRGNGQAALSWDIPSSNGGSAILHYEVQVGTGAWANVGNVTSHTVTGLTNGTTYTFNVRAVNAQGNSPNATTTATPATVPSAPQTFTATAGDAQVVLNWTAPSSNGGSAITSYQVSSDGGTTWVAATSNTGHTFTGLTNGTAYNFAVRAVNDVGNGTNATATATPVAQQPTTFTVTFDLNGGTYAGNQALLSQTITSGNNATPLTQNPTRSGFTFNGWNPALNLNNVTANRSFTAQWSQIVTSGGNDYSPSTNHGWLSPNNVNFDLASPRNLTITLNRGDFTFQNAIRFGSGTNAVNLVRDRDFTATANNNNTTTITIMAEWLSEHMTVGTRHLTFVMSGGNTLSFRLNVTDTRPTTTPDPTPTMPMVQVDLSPALRAELMERLGDRFSDLDVIVTYDIAQTTPQGAAMGDIHGFWDVIVEFIVHGDSADGSDDEIITDFVNHYYLSADMSNFYLGNLNHHRITALNTTSNEYRQYGYIGSIVGGKVVFDPVSVDIEAETPTEIATFALQSNHTGGFMIAYVRNLIRLDLNLTSPLITDLAGNAPQQTMDVLPIIQDSRTLIPIRFIGEALGAELDWTPATADRPTIIHITMNGQTLNIPIGEITPELAALGMDVPAQIQVNRTMLPLRFVSEYFGAVVNWDGEARSIEIIHLPTNTTQPTASSNANHNPLTGRADTMALAREDEDEVVPNA